MVTMEWWVVLGPPASASATASATSAWPRCGSSRTLDLGTLGFGVGFWAEPIGEALALGRREEGEALGSDAESVF